MCKFHFGFKNLNWLLLSVTAGTIIDKCFGVKVTVLFVKLRSVLVREF